MYNDPIIAELREIRKKIYKECGGTMDGLFDFLKKKETENVRNGVFCPRLSDKTLRVAENPADYKVNSGIKNAAND